jgi:protoporphyrin/coproporphyrin ferrochelatase
LHDAISVVGPWPTESHFIAMLARRIRESLEKWEEQYKTKIPVLFTTHSLPKRVVEKDPNYLRQLQATIDEILMAMAGEKKDPELVWRACYQSAGHTPEEWLKPDLTDVLMEMQKEKVPAVLIAPIQFLADHLEILYDLDIAAKAQCDERGIDYHRINLPNTDPLFIEALASLVRE